MQLLAKNRNTVFALFLVLTFAFSSIAIFMPVQPAAAQTTMTMKTYAISDAIPNPIGLGESTLLKVGITQAAPSASYGWSGITITVIKPDGTTQTLGPVTTDSTGSTYISYTPDQVGNYNITTNVPQQTFPITFLDSERGITINAGTILLPSNKSSTLVVTQTPTKQLYPAHSLPTEYWSRPIDPQLREWYSISGNWVARPDNSLALYQADAPTTPHILWNQPYTTGGMSGGLYADGVPAAMFAGDAYEGKFANSVILNGVLYYNTAGSGTYATVGIPGIQAVDLHTGKNLWFLNQTLLSFGQSMFFASYNVNGVFNYLWSVNGANYTAYSPWDGSFQYMFYNVPSGVRVYGPSGEILIYQIDYKNGWMALWNSTLAGQQNDVIGQPSYGSWSFGVLGLNASGVSVPNPTNTQGQQINSAFPQVRNLNAALPKCYSWNVSIPKNLNTKTELGSPSIKVYQDNRIVGMDYNQSMVRIWALPIQNSQITATRNASINTQTLSPIFDKTWAAPAEWIQGSNTIHYTGATNYVNDTTYGNGVMAVFDKELTTHYAFSVVDGSFLWATPSENYLDLYGWGNAEHTWYFAYGKLYSVGLAGIMYAYDLKSGNVSWTYNLTDPYNEPVTGENWWGWIDLIADGKIYIGTLEHSANNPIPRGGPFACVNATDGSEIFRINGLMRETRWGGNPIIGDSIIAGLDTYDLQVYAMGKGATQTTITASPTIVTSGGVMLTGHVTDISPGTQDDAIKLRFPNGVPAVSDESQSQWMMYVYKQFERPINATGVPVAISVVDANGNFRTVGTAQADSNGFFSFAWTPDISGAYTVYATFAGSHAYYGSSAEAAFSSGGAGASGSPGPSGTSAPGTTADQWILPGIIAIIVVVIIVGAVLALLMMRRH
jgi:hypothetical protein